MLANIVGFFQINSGFRRLKQLYNYSKQRVNTIYIGTKNSIKNKFSNFNFVSLPQSIKGNLQSIYNALPTNYLKGLNSSIIKGMKAPIKLLGNPSLLLHVLIGAGIGFCTGGLGAALLGGVLVGNLSSQPKRFSAYFSASISMLLGAGIALFLVKAFIGVALPSSIFLGVIGVGSWLGVKTFSNKAIKSQIKLGLLGIILPILGGAIATLLLPYLATALPLLAVNNLVGGGIVTGLLAAGLGFSNVLNKFAGKFPSLGYDPKIENKKRATAIKIASGLAVSIVFALSPLPAIFVTTSFLTYGGTTILKQLYTSINNFRKSSSTVNAPSSLSQPPEHPVTPSASQDRSATHTASTVLNRASNQDLTTLSPSNQNSDCMRNEQRASHSLNEFSSPASSKPMRRSFSLPDLSNEVLKASEAQSNTSTEKVNRAPPHFLSKGGQHSR